VEAQSEELAGRQRALNEELDQVRNAKEELIEEFRKKAAHMIKKAEKEITDLQLSMKSGKLRSGREPRETLYNIRKDIVETLGTPLERQASAPEPGSRVRVKSLGREGVVREVLDKGRVDVTLGRVTVRSDSEDLIVLDSGRIEKSASKNERIGVDIPLAAPRWEVNVIGLRVDEAIPVVDKALNEAILGGLPSLSIIHGRGTGRLKKAIREYLSTHSLVKGYRPGDPQTGGEGVTFVEPVSE
jgi:DNA mismatch repair protein MutS2